MKKLSTKVVLVFAITTIFITSVGSSILYFNMRNFITDSKEKDLLQEIQLKGTYIENIINKDGFTKSQKNISSISQEVSKFRVFDTGYYLLMDEDFNIKYHPDKSLKNLRTVADGSLSFLADNISESKNNTDSINYFYKGDNKILSYYKLSNGWILASAPVRKEMYIELNRFNSLVILTTVFLIFLSLIVAYFFGRSISQKMLSLKKLALELSNGNIDINFKIKSKDEIGQLSDAFFKVVNNLKNLHNEIDIVTNSVIEGHLEAMSNEDNFNGAYKEILTKINLLSKSLVGHIDKIPLPIMIVDKNYKIIYINSSSSNFLNKPKSKLYGTKCSELFKIENCNTKDCVCSIAMKENCTNSIDTIARPLDNDIDISNIGIPIKDVNGAIIGALDIIIDQTKVKSAERKLAKQFSFQGKEVKKLIYNLKEISNGNFNLNAKTGDYDVDTEEVGKSFSIINDTINNISESLSKIMYEINAAAEQVSLGSNHLSNSSQLLSQGATEQATSIENISSSISEISFKTKNNSSNADNANILTQRIKTNSENISEKMNNMIKAINDINDSSNNISNINKIIDDIAFQTNILALNAAIEAARAGQFGKGFAVVAEEVRNLATRSTEATKDTTHLIENSIKKVTVGKEIALSTSESLDSIVNEIRQFSDIIENISKSSKDQVNNISEINKSLLKVSKVVQTNSATAEESAASSEELSAQSTMLKESVGIFKLKTKPVELSKV
ncbi:MAG: methyl-accepting chemotaxis protein [Clostridiales bacterium]